MKNTSGFNIASIRKDFPILNSKVNGKQLIYFDNAATTQTPKVVIDSIVSYYSTLNANIHRGAHYLSQKATESYEDARIKIANFINAETQNEIIFVRGATEAINLVANSYLNAKNSSEIIFTSGTTHSINLVANGFTNLLKSGDEIIVSHLEHHSNIVPWQMLCEKTGAIMKIIPMNHDGELIFSEYEKLLSNKTKVVFVNHGSNALGTINPVKEIISKAHEFGAAVLIDGAQALPHFEVDVKDLNADFYVASAHKFYGPTGVGILYGKEKWLDKLPPYQGGGEMIDEVTFEKTTYAKHPNKFEAGTPNISGVIASGIAIDYINNIGLKKILKYEKICLNIFNDSLKY